MRSRFSASFKKRAAELYSAPHAPERTISQTLIWWGEIVGAISRARRFTDQDAPTFSHGRVTPLDGFADQAVIAIQNARLVNEIRTILARQTASANALRLDR